MSSKEDPVSSRHYGEEYFLDSVGGAEFFRLYGPRIVKPVLAYALKAARLEKGQKALDAGCGRGELLYQLKERGVEAIGADFAPAALALSRKVSGAPVVRADAKSLPFKDKSFDRIFFMGVLDHLRDWELEACFAEFKRVLKPGGIVLANTCANTDYHKRLTHSLRRRLAETLKLSPPSPPKSSEDELLHVNEHNRSGLEEFFSKIGWEGEVEPRPNEKLVLRALYGELPADFPMKEASAWKRAFFALAFRGPWKKYLARELFCRVWPRS